MRDLAFLLLIFAIIVVVLWVEARVRRATNSSDLPVTYSDSLPKVGHVTPYQATERAFMDREKHWKAQLKESERDYLAVVSQRNVAVRERDQFKSENLRYGRDLAQLRPMLILEQNIRGMYEQLITEAGQQMEKGKNTPQTVMGVLSDAFATALATAIEWREAGSAEPGEVVNARATLANRLLPEPDRSRDRGGMVTERKRDGRAGDSGRDPNPRRPHLYEYDPYGTETGANRGGTACNLPGCGKPLLDSIHTNGRPIFGGSVGGPVTQIGVVGGERMHVEARVSDGPPEVLPVRHDFQAPMVRYEDQDDLLLCIHPGCRRVASDPIHA